MGEALITRRGGSGRGNTVLVPVSGSYTVRTDLCNEYYSSPVADYYYSVLTATIPTGASVDTVKAVIFLTAMNSGAIALETFGEELTVGNLTAKLENTGSQVEVKVKFGNDNPVTVDGALAVRFAV